jgi:hypothetical protein
MVAKCQDALREKAFIIDILASIVFLNILKVHESFAQLKQLSSYNLQQKDECNASYLVINKSQDIER